MADAETTIVRGDQPTNGRPAPEGQADGSVFRILAAASLADERTRVLKHADTFAVFDHYGDITHDGLGEEGIYHEGTRFLSGLLLELEGARPFFLSSTVRDENDQLAVALTNPDLLDGNQMRLPLGTLHLAVRRFLWNGVCYQQLRINNHGLRAGQDVARPALRGRLRGYFRGPRHEAESPRAGPALRSLGGHGGARLSRAGRGRAPHAAEIRSAALAAHRVGRSDGT